MSNEAVLREFYTRTGLTEKWLRQQANARTWGPSKARIDRVRSMAKELIGGSLRTREGEWMIVPDGRSYAEVSDTFHAGTFMPFNDIEDQLFVLLEAREIPPWLASHHRTWRAIQALD
jgi:hypothetical protein